MTTFLSDLNVSTSRSSTILLKIATLNLCLGLKNKRIDIENLMNNIKILCLREVELESIIDPNMLKLKNFQFELEIKNWYLH